MKTLNQLKTKATNIVNFMAIKLANGNVNPSRMKRLLDVLRNVCFEIAKYEEKTASALLEVADSMYAEGTDKAKRIAISKEIEMFHKEINWDSTDCNDEDCVITFNDEPTWNEPAYQANDEFGDLAGHTYEYEDPKHTTIFRYNGKILGDNDFPF